MIIKETNNITLDIYWKGWTNPKQRNEYLSKTRDIANKIEECCKVNSLKDGCTFIKMELPYCDTELCQNANDNEHRYDYKKVEQLLEYLSNNDDVSSVQLELNDLEKGGVNYYIDHPYCKVISYKEGFADIIQLYPF